MTESLPTTEPGLLEFLALRARAASDARLALESGLGLLVAVGALVWHPTGWTLLSSAGACAVGFGLWGITDRELRERAAVANRVVPTLRVARAGAAVLGAAAAVAATLSFLALALGTIIS